MDVIKAARIHPGAKIPTRKHPEDAGLDLYCLEAATIPPNSAQILRTGITLEIPSGYVGLLKPKGGNDHLIGSGVIDAGYQGEVLIRVVNPYSHPLEFAPGNAIAQLLLLPVQTPPVVEVGADKIHTKSTSRGATGGILEKKDGASGNF